MNTEEKKNHVENILAVNALFDDLLGREDALIRFKPDEETWSIHQHIVHCLDVDTANFTRYRKGIVEPGAEITSMDETWTEKLDYHTIPLGDAVDTIKLIRRMTHAHLTTLIDKDWKEFSFFYDKYGVLNFEQIVPAMTRHPQFHRDLIDRNIRLYEEKAQGTS